MDDDSHLLHLYSEARSEDAFRELVDRFLPVVFPTALRQVNGDAHLAQDVSQLVFVALARNARSLVGHPGIAGWLFTTTRFLAAKAVRTEQRRRTREQAAMKTAPLPDPNPESPESLQRVIDEVLMDLQQSDRQVVLLRFYQGLRHGEVAQRLGATENAARKRLDRAVDQLREGLERRGITSTATALAVALESQAAVSIPAGLAAASTTAAVACGAGSAAALWAAPLMALTKSQIGAAAAIMVAGLGGVAWKHDETAQLRADLAQQTAAMNNQMDFLQNNLTAESRRAEAAEDELERLRNARVAAPAVPGSRGAAGSGPTVSAYVAQRLAQVPPGSPTRKFTEVSARGDELVQAGKYAEAVEYFVGEYRTLDNSRPGEYLLALQAVINGLDRLGRPNPPPDPGFIRGRTPEFTPAIEVLRGIRDATLTRFQANAADRNAITELGLENKLLGDLELSVRIYDSLASTVPGRQSLALSLYDTFVERQRYADALVGKPYSEMLRNWDNSSTSIAVRGKDGSLDLSSLRRNVIPRTVSDIEVLAALGKSAEADMLVGKIIAADPSDATKALISARVARAQAGMATKAAP